jgi:hypothetical protein
MTFYLVVVLASVIAYTIGALWYGPLFGKQWRRLMGIAGAKGRMPEPKVLVGGFVATLLMVYAYGVILLNYLDLSLYASLWLAIVTGIGFVATTLLNSVLYERRSWKLYAINVGHYLVALIAVALVFTYFPW